MLFSGFSSVQGFAEKADRSFRIDGMLSFFQKWRDFFLDFVFSL